MIFIEAAEVLSGKIGDISKVQLGQCHKLNQFRRKHRGDP